ncbi:MAG: DNRLRE domain-containing protein [Pirellulaceae bacterium]
MNSIARYRSFLAVAGFTAILFAATSVEGGVLLNQNIITNGSAELGLTGWTSVHGGGGTVWRDSGAGYGFVGEIPQNVLLRQSGVDVSSLASMIDSGELLFSMSGSMYSHASGDYASLWAFFDDGTYVLLNAGQYQAWQSPSATGVVPIGVRSISFEIHLTFSGHPDGFNHAMADSFQFALMAPANRNPNADAGGPYLLRDQELLVLDASDSSDQDKVFGDAINSYSWDLNNDGIGDFTTSDPVASLTYSHYNQYFDRSGNYTVGLSVTDRNGGTGTSHASLSFSSVPEPASLSIFGLVGLTACRIRRRPRRRKDMVGTEDSEVICIRWIARMRILLSLFCGAVIALIATETSAGVLVLTATQDAGLRGDNRNSAEGLDDKLLTEEQDLSYAIVQFDLSSVTGIINSAKLRMEWHTSTILNQGVNVYRFGNAWTESAVTWNNVNGGNDPFDAVIGGVLDIVGSPNLPPGTQMGTFAEWDVTAAAREWYDSTLTNNGLFLRSFAGGTDLSFYSLQHGAGASSPQLVLDA